jgi:hypothetical protein
MAEPSGIEVDLTQVKLIEPNRRFTSHSLHAARLSGMGGKPL